MAEERHTETERGRSRSNFSISALVRDFCPKEERERGETDLLIFWTLVYRARRAANKRAVVSTAATEPAMSDEATNVLRQALAATQSADAEQRKQGAILFP